MEEYLKIRDSMCLHREHKEEAKRNMDPDPQIQSSAPTPKWVLSKYIRILDRVGNLPSPSFFRLLLPRP